MNKLLKYVLVSLILMIAIQLTVSNTLQTDKLTKDPVWPPSNVLAADPVWPPSNVLAADPVWPPSNVLAADPVWPSSKISSYEYT